MNKEIKITAEQSRQAVHGDVETSLDAVTGAVIFGSEEAVRDAMAEQMSSRRSAFSSRPAFGDPPSPPYANPRGVP